VIIHNDKLRSYYNYNKYIVNYCLLCTCVEYILLSLLSVGFYTILLFSVKRCCVRKSIQSIFIQIYCYNSQKRKTKYTYYIKFDLNMTYCLGILTYYLKFIQCVICFRIFKNQLFIYKNILLYFI
jgi:hypothetical protein